MKHITSKFIVFLLLAGLIWTGCESPTNNDSGEQTPAVKVPGAPSDLTVTEADSRLTISWTAVDHAAAYEVWYGTESGGGNRQQYGGDVTRSARTLVQTSASISGLTNNTTYYVWVRAKNSAGVGGFSSAAMGTPRAAVAPPQTLGTAPEIEPGDAQLIVQWTPAEGASTYEVYFGVSGDGTGRWKLEEDVSGTTVSISGLMNGTTYYVWVRGKNSAGTGDFSPPASGTPARSDNPPAAPAAVSVTPGNTRLEVSWEPAEAASSYEVWYGTESSGTGRSQFGGDLTGTTVSISGLRNGTAYYVWVRGKNSAGTGDFSPPASGTPSQPPAAPAGVSVSPGNSRLEVSWEPAEAAESYEVYFGASQDGTGRRKFGEDISGTSGAVTGLTNGETYYVWIKAKNSGGTSDFSAPASGIPQAGSGGDEGPGDGTEWDGLIRIEYADIRMGTESVNPGQAAAVFTFPETEGPWTLSLESGAGSTHNRKFRIEGNRILISEALDFGDFYVRVKIQGSSYTRVKQLTFRVQQTPAAFTVPPAVTPYIGGPNQNKLTVSWTRRPGATGYKVYISTTDNPSGLAPAATINGGDTISADTIPGYTSLPDSTWYYVWVKAFNASGETDFSPVKKQKTSDPIEAFWYTGDLNDFDKYYPYRSDAEGMGWDSTYDYYIIKPASDGSGVHLKYNGGTSGEAYNHESLILYHRRFDPVEAEQASRLRQLQNGSLTTWPIGKMYFHNETTRWAFRLPSGYPPLAGSLRVSELPGEAQGRFAQFGYPADGILPPSGVFIIKDTSVSGVQQGRYYATFYHGMAMLNPNPDVEPNILVVFGDAAYGYCITTQKPGMDLSRIAMYSPSFEHAVDNYSDVEYYNYQIAYVAIPWARREIQWAGSRTNQGGDSNAGWIPYGGNAGNSFRGTNFSSLASWLESQPVNTPASPYSAAVSGVNLRGLEALDSSPTATDPWGWLFDKIKARFVSLDIDGCTGATVGYANNQMGNGTGNPDRQKLVSVRLPSAATRVSRFLFNDCVNLRSVVFPSGLLTIGGRAFQGCAALTSVDIPASITRIDQEAFKNCAGLMSVTIRAAIPPIAKDDTTVTSSATGTMSAYNVFSGCANAVFYVPAGSVSAYAAALGVPADRVRAIGG